MIFTKEHIKKICDGEKTQTRRIGRGIYKVGKDYAIQPCRTCKSIENHRIRIDDIWEEKAEEVDECEVVISQEDAWAEGGYTPTEFEEIFANLNQKWLGWFRWVFKFHVVKVEAKEDNVV